MLEDIEQQLLVRPRAFADESVSGYLARLAWANGFGSSRRLLQLLGVPLQRNLMMGARDNIFYRLGGREPSASRCDNHFKLFSNQYICPQCVREAGYLREIWDYALLPICLLHGTRLMAGCARCHRRYSRLAMPVCECSVHEFAYPNQSVSAQAIELVTLLARRLGFSHSTPPNNFPPLLHRLDPDTLQRIVLLVGGYRAHSFSARPRKAPIKTSVDSALSVIEAAADTLLNWPDGLMPVLAASASDLPIKRGLRQSVGHAYIALHRDFTGEARDFLVEGFEHCLSQKWREYLQCHWRHDATDSAYVRITPFARAYGISKDRLLAWIEQGALDGQVRKSATGRRLATLRQGQEDRLRQLLEGWSLMQVAQVMGLPERRLRELLEDNLVRGVAPRQGAQWSIDPSEIERIRNQLTRLSVPRVPPHWGLSLDHALRYRLPNAQRFSPLFQAILDRLIAIHLEAPGTGAYIRDLLLCETDLHSWLRRDDVISIPRMAAELGIKQEVAYHFINRGLIRCTAPNRLGRQVPRAEVERFRERFIFSRDIARYRRTSPKTIVQFLQSLGIHPVSGPSVDGGRQYVYARAAVPPILLISVQN